MKKTLNQILDNVVSQIPSQVGLKLPKLKKKTDGKSTAKINLPKLKKVT